MDYETLTAHFAPSETGGLEVRLVRSNVSQSVYQEFGLSPEEMATLLQECPSTAAGIWRHLRCEALEIQGPEQMGARLFKALFPDSLRAILDQAWGLAFPNHNGLRLQLWLRLKDPQVVRLGRLPWELLYDPQMERFLLRDQRWLLARALEGAEPCSPRAISLPLRVLVAMASPKRCPPLDIEREKATIAKALAGKAFQVEYLEKATLKGLRKALRKEPHVVHWIGHGDIADAGREGELLFEDGKSAAVPVPGEVLAECLRGTGVGLVVLNGCETGRIPKDPLAGVATALVRAGLPAVVAMQRPILDDSAIRFSEAFYERLVAGDPVDAALSEARLALFIQDRESLEWAIPVLYLHSSQIFKIEPPVESVQRDRSAEIGHPASASLPYPIEKLLEWRPAGVPVCDVLAAIGCFHSGFFAALVVLVLIGRADMDPFWLFLFLAGLLPLSVGLAVASARRRPGLRGPWLFLAVFAALLTLVSGSSR